MNEWEALGLFFEKIWDIFQTPMKIPFIGTTSPMKIAIFLSMLSYMVTIVNGFLGGKDDAS